MLIKYVKLYPDAMEPIRLTEGAAGFDLPAYHVLDIETGRPTGALPATVGPGGKLFIGTGLSIAVPLLVVCEIDPRSGWAIKRDLTVANATGTVDSDYRGEVGVCLRNLGERPRTIEQGDRIAQAKFKPVIIPQFVQVDELPPTPRGSGGFGSTGYGAVTGGQEWQERQRSEDRYYMDVAESVAGRSNCLRGVVRGPDGTYPKDADGRYMGAQRRFGCVIVRDDRILAHGFNHRDEILCTEGQGCGREREGIESGTSPEQGCRHAEGMALESCMRDGTATKGATAYVTAEPCLMCAKQLFGAQVEAVVVPEGIYPRNGLKYLLAKSVEVRYVRPKE
jgi:dUTP pyrophosphatase